MKKKKPKKTIIMLLTLMCLTFILSCDGCKKDENINENEYTFRTWTTALGTNWNPHTWESNADNNILSYLTSPFVDMSIKDSGTGEYQWVYEMATEVNDVTESRQNDLIKYGSTLPEGKKATDIKKGYVYEIVLNENAKWENGDKITAEDYIYSMQKLLDSKMRNYRANLYISGENAIAGAYEFYNSEVPLYKNVVPSYDKEETPDYSFDIEANKVYINLKSSDMTIATYSFEEMVKHVSENVGNDAKEKYEKLLDEISLDSNPYGYIEVTEENYDMIVEAMDYYLSPFGLSIYKDIVDKDGNKVVKVDEEGNPIYAKDENGNLIPKLDSDGNPLLDNEGNPIYEVEYKKEVDMEMYMEFLFYQSGYGEKVDYSTVGLYKDENDDYKIYYVLKTYQDLNYFLTSLTSTWLVHKETYEKGMDVTGDLVTTNYGTSKDTTMSYGVYKLEALQPDRQIVFTQNENWYGFSKMDNGVLYSETNFLVNGEKIEQYQTTKIIIDVMTEDAAEQKFFSGELSEWAPTATELSKYTLSDRLVQMEETYTMSFFFNTNLNHLKEMDKSKGNKNSVVLSNIDFRKAFSLAIDRAEWVTATPGYAPSYSLMNDLYHYDIYNDPKSNYRASKEAMQAICNLYGVEYGENKAYSSLEEAYASITGYNLTEAKSLMKKACEALVKEGLYKKGEEIKIRIGWAKGALTSDDNSQIALMNKYINEAVKDSGFGKVTLEAIGNIDDRYADVPAGEYAIGFGAWGGAAFYPFRNFQVYMDPSQYRLNEAANWDPTKETLTLTVDGNKHTLTYQEWSKSMMGTGRFANSSFETKLSITAQLEENFLKKYYRIPLASTALCSLLSYQCDYYTQTYNIMYGFGGLRLMTYNYTDYEWNEYVKSLGGKISYS